MDQIPQDATVNKRQMIILAMRGSQEATNRAIKILTANGVSGEQEAAKEMALASRYSRAAALLMDPKQTAL